MRECAMNCGAAFLCDMNVTRLLQDDSDRVIGVECENLDFKNSKATRIMSDVVVVAAGIGSADAALGGIPILHRPGRIAFARPHKQSQSNSLTRVLVDTVNEAHVLQRPDGSIVAGGGYLEVGGSPSHSGHSSGSQDQGQLSTDNALFNGAQQLAPTVLKKSSHAHVAEAMRPIPKDGLPAVGYLNPCLYAVITHSGVTLAPFLSTLVAVELVKGVELDILEPYHPQRLFS